MPKPRVEQGSKSKVGITDHLETWLEAFLFDRQAQNVSDGTLYFYRAKFKKFLTFCDTRAITGVEQLTPNELRRFMAWLEERGHNPGGRHAIYRAVKTFLLWYEDETEPEGWRNPIRKVKPPIAPTEPLEPVSVGTVRKMAAVCERGTFYGDRDRAILLSLFDTGTRAQEFLDLDLEHLNLTRGDVFIRHGKGRKPRMVFLGRQSRRAVRAYLKHRHDNAPALWVTEDGNRLTYWGLRQVIQRRADDAGVECPGLHDFR